MLTFQFGVTEWQTSIQVQKKNRRYRIVDIKYSKQSLKFLSQQDKPTRIRIVNAINNLPSGDVKKITGA